MFSKVSGAALALCLCHGPVQAGLVERSLLPQLRPAGDEVVARAVSSLSAPAAKPDTAPALSLMPALRPASLAPQTTAQDVALAAWLRGFRARALAQGISGTTFDRAFAGLRYDADVIRRDRSQAEFTKTIGQYLDGAVSDTRIANGRDMLRRHASLLDRIEARYGVEKEVVVAIWGMESAYGAYRGSHSVIGSMATLAHDGRRKAFFEGELIAALRILQDGHTTPDRMKGSWAGAMGHTQFMPTSFQALAVDFTGDGRRDIWGDDPADALASTANYLARSGWTKGQPWGVEVRLPAGFDYAQARRDVKRLPSQWARLGVRGVDGRPVPDHGRASVLLPAGARGSAFLIFDNFRAIERYNAADAYVIGVGHLSDRLAGKGPFVTGWPDDARSLTRDERKELQRRLTARGYATGGIDGRIGPKTQAALRRWQQAAGLVADGYANLEMLARLR